MALDFIYNLIIAPLVYLYELVFNLSNKIIAILFRTCKDPIFFSILMVSIVVNLFSFPLYASADKMQNEEKNKKDKMKKYVDHINKTFSGDERYMMLNAYYKNEHYNPIFQLRQAFPLLLQIPFFTAVYIFFVNCKLLAGAKVSFLPFITDLYLPDSLFKFGDITINILPIAMTIINLISVWIYTRGLGLKDKVQPVALAIIFLLLLYNSPSGLVIYWTLNNIFSLFKSVYSKLNAGKSADRVLSGERNKNFNSLCKSSLCTIFILLGLLIPSNIIVSSPSEFILNGKLPYGILLNSITIFLGLTLWTYLVYYMTSDKSKPFVSALFLAISIYFILNHFAFINNLGTLTENLKYTNGFRSYNMSLIKRDLLLMCISFVLFLLSFKLSKYIYKIVYIIAASMFLICVINLFKIHFQLNDYLIYENKSKTYQNDDFNGKLKLSKNGKNVIVLMLDRSCGKYFDYVLGDRKEFKEIYDGFIFYDNAVSAGSGTIVGSTALYGGYDYLPQNANKRTDTLLVDKQNEALTIMPYNFSNNGYDCVVANLPYENYYMGDREPIFKNMQGVTRIDLWGNNEKKLYEDLGDKKVREVQKHNFIMYSFMKVAPISLKGLIYGDGRYFSIDYIGSLKSLGWWYALENMVDKSHINDDDSNNFWLIDNELTHNEDDVIYPYGNFSPIYENDIESYPEIYNKDGVKFDGLLPHLSTEITAYNQFAKFIKYLKDNNVYDNTRIIITSDHGASRGNGFKNVVLNDDKSLNVEPISYNCTFLFKDFNAKGPLKYNNDFISNADTPYLAFEDVIANPINPYLNKSISYQDKNNISEIDVYAGGKGFNAGSYINDYAFKQYIISIKKGNIFDARNWFYKNEAK